MNVALEGHLVGDDDQQKQSVRGELQRGSSVGIRANLRSLLSCFDFRQEQVLFLYSNWPVRSGAHPPSYSMGTGVHSRW